MNSREQFTTFSGGQAYSPMSLTLIQVLVGGVLLGAVYALFSSGLTLIWGMMNVINFAHGDFVMIGMYVSFIVWKLVGFGPAASIPIAAVVLATVGIIAYFALVRHVMKGPMLAQILGTFGLALLLRYAIFWGFGANFLSLPENFHGLEISIPGRRCALGSFSNPGDRAARVDQTRGRRHPAGVHALEGTQV